MNTPGLRPKHDSATKETHPRLSDIQHTADTQNPVLLHKEARTAQGTDGRFEAQTKCGITVDNALHLLHHDENMAKAALNPQVLARGERVCPRCTSSEEMADIIETLLENPDTRAQTLEAMNRATPGDPHIELALVHETNPDFRKWLNERVWQLNQHRQPTPKEGKNDSHP